MLNAKNSLTTHNCMALLALALSMVSASAFAQEQPDLDKDGVLDQLDVDQDNDGITNFLEGMIKLETLSELPAQSYNVMYTDSLIHSGSSHVFNLIGSHDGEQLNLTGTVLNTDTTFDWSLHETLPKFRNLDAGSSTVEWTLGTNNAIYNLDLTITDLDGIRDETISVAAKDVAGYSLAPNTNVTVTDQNGILKFTGTGTGRDLLNDSITLHIRQLNSIVLRYINTADDSLGAGSEIAGYRHSFEGRNAGSYFYSTSQFRDTDSDGVADHRDLDSDNDGLGDVIEAGGIDTDNNNIMDGEVDVDGLPVVANPNLTNALLESVYAGTITVDGDDDDGDGILSSVDGQTDQFGGSRAGTDTDNDGLQDLDEIRVFLTDPLDSDTDNDGLDDLSELQQHSTNPLVSDTDNDGLSDSDEVMVFDTDPNNTDTDSDGMSDAVEIQQATNPLLEPQVETPPVTEIPTVTPIEPVVEPVVDPVVQPVPAPELGAVDDTDVAVLPLQDDPTVQPAGPSFQTGINGAPGCSSASGSRDPLLALLLCIAMSHLFLRRRNA